MINDILLSSGRLVDSPGLHHHQSQAQRGRHGRSWGVDLSEIKFSAVQTNGFGLERVFWGVISWKFQVWFQITSVSATRCIAIEIPVNENYLEMIMIIQCEANSIQLGTNQDYISS